MIIRTITPEFADERGEIRNLPLLEELRSVWAAQGRNWSMAANIALITSKAGSDRSNHWHKRSSHWVVVLSGLMYYSEREVGAEEWTLAVTIGANQAVFTGPGVEHKTEFPVDTVCISISDMPQTTAEHEADVVRV